MRARLILWIAVPVSVALSACSSIAHKSPDEMVRYAVQHTLTRDNQYNFEGKLSVVEAGIPAESTVPQADTDAKLQSTTDTAVAATVADDSHRAEGNGTGSRKGSPVTRNWVRHWINSLSMPYSGAVDIPKGRFELVPELRYDTRNAMVSIKMPLQFDLNDVSILADPSAVAPFIDIYAAESKAMRPVGEKLVRITLPEKIKQHIPLQSIMAALPKALDDGYAVIGKEAYRQLEMDEAGRAMGAHYRIGMEVNAVQNKAISAAIFDSLREQMAAAAKNNPQDGIRAEDYKKTDAVLAWLADLYGRSPTGAVANSLGQVDEVLRNIKNRADFYLDRRGRILAVHQNIALPAEVAGLPSARDNKTLNVVSQMRLHYTKNPTFTLKSNAQNTLDLRQAFPALAGALDEATGQGNTPSAQLESLQALSYELEGVSVKVE